MRGTTVPSIPGPAAVLAVYAVLMEVVYVACFLRPFPLATFYRVDVDMGGITSHSHGGFFLYIASLTGLFLLLAAAWSTAREVSGRLGLWIVLVASSAFAATAVWVYPITAIDIYAYVAQSRIMTHYHQNPIFVPPAAFPGDSLMRLSDGWSGAGAPYGPLGLVIDAVPSVFAGGNLLLALVLTKAMFAAMLILSALTVYRIVALLRPDRALQAALLVAWNPLLIIESVINGHNDIAMMLFALLAILSLLEGDNLLALVLLVSACLIKFGTLVLVPLFVLHVFSRLPDWRMRLRFGVLTCISAVGVTAIAYWHFWQGPETLTHLFDQNLRYLNSFGTVISDALRGTLTVSAGVVVGRLLYVALYALCLRLALGDSQSLMRACFLALSGLLALALTNVESWYAVWPMLVAACDPELPVWLASQASAWGISLGAAFFGYEWWWMGITKPGTYADINDRTYFFSFVPACCVLLLASAWSRGLPRKLMRLRTG